MDNVFNKLYNQDTIAKLEAQYGFGGSGLPSQARHQAALNELSKNLNIGSFGPGNLFTALAASATEIPDVIKTGDIKESARDVFDNLKGALATDKSKTPAEVYRDVYEGGSNQSGIVEAIKNVPSFLSNLFFTPVGAGSDVPNLPNIDITNQLDDYYEKGEMMNNVADAPEAGITTKLLDAIKGAGGAISDLGIVGVLKNLDQFKTLSPAAQEFILQQAGGNVPMKDKYGYNIRSALGNYASLVDRRANIARSRQRRGLALREMDKYYLDKELERQELQRQEQEAQAARDRARAAAAYSTQTGEGSGYTGGFEPSTGNYDDPFSPGDTE